MTTMNVPITIPARIDQSSEESCAACEHPLADHDATGRRYCAATTNSALTRGCICAK
jgi:hypothetical protein